MTADRETKQQASLRDRAEDALDNARERAIEAYDSALDSAREAGRNASEKVSDAPLVALGSGLALGAIIAALLPIGRREKQLLSPVADRIRTTATDAAGAAREAGEARLTDLGLTRARGGDVVKNVIDGAGEALRESARAAVSSIKGERD